MDSKLDTHSNSLSDAFKQVSRVRTYVDDRIHEGMRDPFANPGLQMPVNTNILDCNMGRNYNSEQLTKSTMTGSEDEHCDIRKETMGNRNRSGSNGFYDLRHDQRMLAQGKIRLQSFSREGKNFEESGTDSERCGDLTAGLKRRL